MENNFQGVIPMIAYENGAAAVDWLCRVFGFQECINSRQVNDNGTLTHAELETGYGLVMLATPTPDYESPKHHRETCEQAQKWSQVPYVIDGVLVYVDNLDEHFERAIAAGATILSMIQEDVLGRRYRAEDLEGHRWYFFERNNI